MLQKITQHRTLIGSSVLLAGVLVYLCWFSSSNGQYSSNQVALVGGTSTLAIVKPAVSHVETPQVVKAVYMTNYVADVKDWRQRIKKLIDTTELNAVVIDIKDYTGVYVTDRAPDIKDFIEELHKSNIYVIGRLSVFQDQKYVKEHPEFAVKRKDNGDVWRDRKGIAWLDAGSHDVWDYIVGLAKKSHDLGFDEINFDYIRYPSDGDMQNTLYTHSSSTIAHSDQLKLFFAYLDQQLRPQGIPISADLFGMTTTASDDMGIGQILENALPHFDFVDPMVYPSHFPPHFNGWADPNKVPYDIIKYTMTRAIERANLLDGLVATTTPPGPTAMKLRPWLQDFNYGGHYGEAEVRAQKKATYDVGLSSWLMWDPGVKYTSSAFNPS